MSNKDQQTYVVMGLDIAAYSEKTAELQLRAAKQLDKFLHEAIKSVFPDKPLPGWADAGDGGFCMFPGADMKTLDVGTEFYKRLNDHNTGLEAARQIHVRTAFHKDLVHPWDGDFGRKYSGVAINQCARLLSAMNRTYQNQVICSENYYKEVAAYDRSIAKFLRMKDGKDKHGHTFKIYNVQRDPGLGVRPKGMHLHRNPAAT